MNGWFIFILFCAVWGMPQIKTTGQQTRAWIYIAVYGSWVLVVALVALTGLVAAHGWP